MHGLVTKVRSNRLRGLKGPPPEPQGEQMQPEDEVNALEALLSEEKKEKE
jgi:hypothetical protein